MDCNEQAKEITSVLATISLLGYNIMQSYENELTFRGNISPRSSTFDE
jgi:hypothetical protein